MVSSQTPAIRREPIAPILGVRSNLPLAGETRSFLAPAAGALATPLASDRHTRRHRGRP